MSRRYFLLFLVGCILVYSIPGCTQSEYSSVKEEDEVKLQELEKCICKQPQLAVDKVDKYLLSGVDSITYYRLLVDKAKSFFFLSELDSAKVLLDSVRAEYEAKGMDASWENILSDAQCCSAQQKEDSFPMHSWLSMLFVVAMSLGTVFWALHLYRRRKEEKRVWELQTAINSLRLDNVRNRISPHFIFNVLNHEMQYLESGADKKRLSTLIHLLRRQLELADQISISLSDELDFIHYFLELEKDSLGKDFKFTQDVDPSIDLDSLYIPSMSIYILVENAVKHSLTIKEGERKLWLQIVSEEDSIKIKIRDNGGGFKSNQQSLGTGTGFKVITRTIQLYNQYNEKPIHMDIRNVDVGDAETGCEVSYTIPKGYKFIIKS